MRSIGRHTGRVLVAALLLTLRCGKSERAVTINPGSMPHTEIRADQLPAPYSTPSASNPSFTASAPSNATLTLPPRFQIAVYADGDFQEPRMMALAPNHDVFVSDGSGGMIDILRDENGDGRVDQRFVFARGLHQPFGLAFHEGYLYVGDTDAVLRFRYRPGQTVAEGGPERIVPLPEGGHWTRNLIFSRDGKQLFVSVGSSSNADVERDPIRAAISVMDPDGQGRRIFAGGLRNPVGLGLNPANGELWAVINERDGLGDDLPPDYATSVRDGDFFGWPYAYLGIHPDPRLKEARPDLVAKTRVPDVLIQAHSAPIGITFYDGRMFPPEYRGSAFVALHGSWNRSHLTGYKIISIPFRNGRPTGGYDDFVDGWSPDPTRSRVWGRPAGLLVLADGSILIADDGTAKIWRVTYK